MSRFIYTPEMLKFIEAKFKKAEVPQVTKAFNKKFGTDKTAAQIKSTITNHGIKCGRKPSEVNKGKLKIMTNKQADFVKSEYLKSTVPELTVKLKQKFGLELKPKQVKDFIKNQGYQSGRTGQFKKGLQPWNTGKKGYVAGGRSSETRFKPGHQRNDTQPVGAIRSDRKDGYLMIKVEMPNKWKLLHVVEWEKHNGPIPKGHRLWFKDNDRTNWNIDNLMLITRAQGAVINKQGFGAVPAEFKQAAVTLADISMKRRALTTSGAAA
jgi:hypothetical protein